jgi:biopolymer transport protein ExbD
MPAKLAAAGGGRYDLGQNSEINVTPFVDVMLVLLIIFMVAAPLATVNVKLDLPKTTFAPKVDPPKPIYISLQRSKRLWIGDFPTSLETLAADLKTQIDKRNPSDERIFIRSDAEVPYQDFMKLMNALQDAGFYSVALVGDEVAKT